jgi:hypothetical protein
MAGSDERELLEGFRTCRPLCADLTGTVSDLLRKILSEQGVSLHSVTHRVKDEASLEKSCSVPTTRMEASGPSRTWRASE